MGDPPLQWGVESGDMGEAGFTSQPLTQAPCPHPKGRGGRDHAAGGKSGIMNTRPAGGAVDVAHPGGGRGGMCGSDLPPPHTLQSTGQQQRPRGVQSWVSILVPVLLHELGGLRQPPPRTASPSWLGGGVQWPHPGGSRGDAGMGGSWRPSLPSPGSRASGRRVISGAAVGGHLSGPLGPRRGGGGSGSKT